MSTSKFMLMGGREDDFEAAFDHPADVICLDLEDTVAAGQKEKTRAAVGRFLALGRGRQRRTAVRLSPLSTFDGLRDLLLMQQLEHAPYMVVLAKADSAQEVALVRDLLQPVFGHFHLQPIIETALALGRVEQIASVPGIGSLSLGGKDLSESLRVDRSWESLLYARGRCAAAAAAAGIPIVDGPQSRDTTPDELRTHCERLKALGYAGKSAVFAEHLSTINGIWTGPATQRESAR